MSLEHLKDLTDEQLHFKTIEVAGHEREVTLRLLKHLNEVESRHLFSKYACSSLHAYCVKELRMSDAQAGRRVAAARLLCEMPKTEVKLLNGDLSLTSAAQAKLFFRKEASIGHKIDLAKKEAILESLELKSVRQVSEILISESAKPEAHFQEMIKPKTETHTEVRLYLDQETMSALDGLKEIWSHAMPRASFSEIIKRSVIEAVDRHDPIKKAERAVKRKIKHDTSVVGSVARSSAQKAESSQASSLSDITHRSVGAGVGGESEPTEAQSLQVGLNAKSGSKSELESTPESKPNPASHHRESIPAAIKHQVLLRDGGRCGFTEPRSGDVCGARHFLQLDHIVPVGLGGESSVENLRLRCQAHNFRHGIEALGPQLMWAMRDK